jgi:hypothetical protein
MALIFPPAPPGDEAAAAAASLMPLDRNVQALALGATRLLGVTGRHEVHGEPQRLAIRAAHGAYLRLTRDASGEWTLAADGANPADDSCVFTLQKGGVALHLKVTLRTAAGTLVGVARGGEVRAARGAADGRAGSAEECERWRVEPAPAGSGAVSFQCRDGGFLSAEPAGYVSARAPRAASRAARAVRRRAAPPAAGAART